MSADTDLKAIIQRIQRAEQMYEHDPERGHEAEDELMRDVLRHVVANHPHHKQMAIEILRLATNNNVIRWYT